MSSIQIEGGQTISGELKLSGNKNAALPMIAASLLTDDELILSNVPNILDVQEMLKIAENLGVSCEYENSILKIRASNVNSTDIPRDLCSRIRSSLLFTGPLLTRHGKASLWPPGGDIIGKRRLDSHIYGLKSLGVKIVSEEPPFKFRAGSLEGKELFFDEASVTATEHIMMTATLAKGRTVIRNAAAEPHVQDLAELLNKMGAKITGTGTNTLIIDGVKKMHGAEHSVTSDHIEAGSFLVMAAVTGGELTVTGTVPKHYWMIRRIFERFGIDFELSSDCIHLPAGQKLRILPDFGNAIPVISDGPWPQYPSDLMSCAIVMATRTKGTVLFFEKMFESRIYFVDRLNSMGANIIVCDPHRVLISGPSRLYGVDISSPDIRAGMALLIAALTAKGTSTIHNTEIISRGYESIVKKIQSLGGKIKED